MTPQTLVLYLCITLAVIQDLQSVNIIESSKHQFVKQNNASVADFYCNTDAAIEKCQFLVWNLYNNILEIITDRSNLSMTWMIGNTDRVSVRNFNTDLSQGRCGISVQGRLYDELYSVVCRVRAVAQEWTYRFMTLYVGQNATVPTTDLLIQPEEFVLASPHTYVSVTCSTPLSNACNFFNSVGTVIKWNDTRSNCRISVQVTERHRGMTWCKDGKDYKGTTVIAIKAPTSQPRLALSESFYRVGEILEATCSVSESRPQANITWYLGDDLLRGDDVREVQDGRWIWSWDSTGRSQTLRRQVRAEDDGKTLTCAASHIGLKTPLRSWATIYLRRTTSSSARPTTKSTTTTIATTTTIESTRTTIASMIGDARNSSSAELSTVDYIPWLVGSNIAWFVIVLSGILYFIIRLYGGCCHRAPRPTFTETLGMSITSTTSCQPDDNVYDDVGYSGR